MPAVAIPIIAGVAAGAGSALVVSTATAIAIGTAVASATMMITAKKPSLGDYRSASERSQILRAAASDKTCTYGRVISSGLMSFAAEQAGEQEEGEWLHIALVISGHKLSRIGDIWLGDDLVGTFGGLVSYELHVDRQTCDPFMLANCADWREDMIGQGITWLRISFKFDAEKFPAGLPNIKIEKFGKEVWDPRDGQWKWSRNAALVILDYYRTWLNVPDDELRLDEFIQAANICDELVAIPGGGTEPRYSLDVEFDLGEARVKVLEAMHMACAAQPTYVGGKHGIIAGAYYGPASDELRAHQIVGDTELLPEPPSSDKINQVAGTFVDPVSFKKTDFPAVIVPEWVEEDGGQPLVEDLDLRCVTSEHQAQRLANIILRQRRNARTLTCSVNLSGWRYRPGQTIRLYIPALGIQGPEFRVSDWAFSLNNGVDLTLREDSPLFWADAIGKPMTRPEITELPTGGVAMPDQLRYEVEQLGEVLQGVLSWQNSGRIAYNQVIVQRLAQGATPVTVMTAQVPGQSCRINGLAAGNYVAMVRAVALTGAHSPVAAVNFTIAVPATPTGVEVEAGNWALALRPLFAGGHDYSVLCEWWWSHIDHPLGEAMAKATPAGIAAYMTLQGLRPDTEYFVWLRAVNAYGKSGLIAARARTSYDVASILDVLDGEIGAEQLRQELREPIERIPELEEMTDGHAASIAELQEVVLGDGSSVVSKLETLTAAVDLAAEAALGGALGAATEADRQRRSIGQIRHEQKILVDQTKALAETVDTVQVELDETSAAVQTVARAQADLAGQVEAGWYTKAQINGEGGGFGLSVQLTEDGSVLSSFVIDADVFAVLSRAIGETSTRHPFVVKNGSVYMNHALMDTAEIGNVIAKYIDVQHLVGALIEGGSFRGGDLWIGENPAGEFVAYGKNWNAGIDSNGQFFGSNVYFSGGTFKGNMVANSGTLNNVTILETCSILGTLSADRIVGDVAKVYALETFLVGDSLTITIPAYTRARHLVISGIEIYAKGSTQGGGGDHADRDITASASCSVSINGVVSGDSVSASGAGSYASTICGKNQSIPANQATTVTISFTGGYRLRGSVMMVFMQ
ncbi:DUF1983 domain-containing protein [Aeromonas sp. LsrichE-8G]|uniref:phage tail tip fiber protein n=1 Tax=Aeromonas sp. LsrichE-8G TaxID=2932048 RepID=UPI001FD5529C|nr:DUF1983 domain-containing protein [Aeromonas sp. LsrichE-8G]MCJ7930968.1 DUF1983 domain-containing protein [Aeromonas sp. LsrichE-8G]